MNAFARALALEVDRDGIAVHIVTPGPVETEMLQDVPFEMYAIQSVRRRRGGRLAGHRRPVGGPAGDPAERGDARSVRPPADRAYRGQPPAFQRSEVFDHRSRRTRAANPGRRSRRTTRRTAPPVAPPAPRSAAISSSASPQTSPGPRLPNRRVLTSRTLCRVAARPDEAHHLLHRQPGRSGRRGQPGQPVKVVRLQVPPIRVVTNKFHHPGSAATQDQRYRVGPFAEVALCRVSSGPSPQYCLIIAR